MDKQKPTQRRVRAVIIKDDSILLMKRVKEHETYWVFPGGGIKEGENEIEALKREVKEEMGVEIEVGDLFVHLEWDEPDVKQSQNWFLCTIVAGKIGAGSGPEFSRDTKTSGRYFIELAPISRLKEITLYPLEVRDLVIERLSS